MAELDLYSHVTPVQATAACDRAARPTWYCDGQFAVLPEVVLVFATLGEGESGTRFASPSVLTWVPTRTDYHPSDPFPWLPAPVRETWDFQRQEHTRTHHLFVRKPGEGTFQYVGLVHLSQYGMRQGRCSARFELAERLPRELWIGFDGYPGWLAEVNHVRHRIAVGDAAALEPLLATLRQSEFGHFTLTRYEEDSLHLRTNPQRGWLMYLADPGDSGRYVRNPRQESDPEEYEEFYCGCGTGLEFPFRHTLPWAEAARAVYEFFLTGEPPAWVSWGDDEDGDEVDPE